MTARVIYVDEAGRRRPARTVGAPLPDAPIWLVVGGGGLRVVRARYSEGHEPGTWHYPS